MKLTTTNQKLEWIRENCPEEEYLERFIEQYSEGRINIINHENGYVTALDGFVDIILYELDKLVGIPALKKGAILINLLFKISINGILNVSINGFKNPFNEDNKNFDYKVYDNIKLISSYMARELLKRILSKK